MGRATWAILLRRDPRKGEGQSQKHRSAASCTPPTEDVPATKVGTNLTDIVAHRKITIRELGGCMGPIWSSYYGDCRALLFMVDASNPTQLSASCAQLLGLLSAEPLADAPVLILFNKTDLSCYMTVEEMKSLIRLPDIIACATQTITVADVSARTGTGLAAVLQWLQDTHGAGR
uniref:ADP ribosylation factor like GTPase 16 n=1 Tax=Pipistrellus kuhlii TaxID=59472 RepID=A0A7J7SEM6_PIPKU|nr:ADP ribosylation factor like GTPase 16 [Pipistrellus kuhlii]